jgi:hypothetical protein
MNIKKLMICVLVILLSLLFTIPTASIEEVIIVQYADAVDDYSFIYGTNPELDDRIIMEAAQYNSVSNLNYPIDLVEDNLAPVITSGPLANLDEHGNATILWFTDEYSDSIVNFGRDSGVYISSISDALYAIRHELTITGLDECDTYYYQVESNDRSGNSVESDEHSFTTGNSPSDLSASNDSPTILGYSTTFSASVISDCPVVFNWDFGDGAIGTGMEVEHEYHLAGNYTAIVSATNTIGEDTTTTNVNIYIPIYLPIIVD